MNTKLSIYLRYLLGLSFLVAGLYKILHTDIFISSIVKNGIFSKSFYSLTGHVIPYLEILLGSALIFFRTYLVAAYFSITLLLSYAVYIFWIANKEFIGLCNCFVIWLFINIKNPIVLLAINHIMILFCLVLIINKKNIHNKILFTRKSIYAIGAIITMMIVTIMISNQSMARAYENDYITKFTLARKEMLVSINKYLLDRAINKNFNKDEMNNIGLIDNGKYHIILIMHNYVCRPCIDEAIYFEKMFNKYSDKANYYLITGNIGKTAISKIRKEYSLSYPIIQDTNNMLYRCAEDYNGPIKFIISPAGVIINIDPPTYNILSIQKEYENIIDNFILQRSE